MNPLYIDVFLATFFFMVGVHYTGVTLGLKKRDGRSRIHYGSAGSTTWIVRWTFNTFRLMILGFMIGRLFWSGIDQILVPYSLPLELWFRSIGVLLMVLSFYSISYTHTYMGSQWQSGLNTERFQLLECGPYQRCRHPIFAAVILGMVGFTLALPSVFTAVCLFVGILALTRQASEEERSLRMIAEYKAYSERTAKWPWYSAVDMKSKR